MRLKLTSSLEGSRLWWLFELLSSHHSTIPVSLTVSTWCTAILPWHDNPVMLTKQLAANHCVVFSTSTVMCIDC